jgi:hypothetical protein
MDSGICIRGRTEGRKKVETDSPQAITSPVMGVTGELAVLGSRGIRTHVPSP